MQSHWRWNHTITRSGSREAFLAHPPGPAAARKLESSPFRGREAGGAKSGTAERAFSGREGDTAPPQAGSDSFGHYGQTEGREREVEWARSPGSADSGGLVWSALSRPLETRRDWALLYSEVRGEWAEAAGPWIRWVERVCARCLVGLFRLDRAWSLLCQAVVVRQLHQFARRLTRMPPTCQNHTYDRSGS